MLAFADHERKHLIMEDAVLASFARKRLTNEDLATLSQRDCVSAFSREALAS